MVKQATRKYPLLSRLQERRNWLLLLPIIGLISFFIGRWMFQEVSCTRLQLTILALMTLAGWFIINIFAFIGPDSLPAKILSIAALLILPITGTIYLSPLVARDPIIVASFCPPEECQRASQVRELLSQGEFDAAKKIAEICMQEAVSSSCSSNCGCGLTDSMAAEVKAEILNSRFIEAHDVLSKARAVNQQYACGQDTAIDALQLLLDEKLATPTVTPTITPEPPPTHTPTPTPRPYLLSVLQFLIDNNTLRIDLKVEDKGLFVRGLNEDDFNFYIDSQPAEITSFLETRADDPVCLMIVVDNSGSISMGLKEMHDSIRVVNEERQPTDEIGLVTFAGNDEVKLAKAPEVGTIINPLLINGSGIRSAIWDGVIKGIDAAATCDSRNRYVILTSDGDDNQSLFENDERNEEVRVAALAKRAVEAGVKVCTIGIPSVRPRPDLLSQLALSTGCKYYSAADFDNVASFVKEIVGSIREFYRLNANIDNVSKGTHRAEIQIDSAGVYVDFKR
jgi:hypothetical protein